VSLHKSLVGGGKLQKTRSVYTRAERIKILTDEGRLLQGDKVLGLPKVRTTVKKAKKKEKKAEEATAAAAAAPAADKKKK
jgi:small basic protein (TIGR04137 family)